MDNIRTIIAGVQDSGKIANGVNVGASDRYILVRSDPGVFLILKKGGCGIIANKTNQCKKL